MVVARPPLPASRRAKWASDLIERLDHSQRGIVRGIKTTVEPQLDLLGDMVLDATGQKKPVDRWLDKLVPGLALGVGLLLLVALTMPLPRSRRPGPSPPNTCLACARVLSSPHPTGWGC